jgi:uncharacterized phage protein gp47/JayE
MYGIVQTGFNPKPYDAILNDKKNRAMELFGSSVDLTETSPLLKLLEVQALEEAELWEMAEAMYYNGYVDFATGNSLDSVCALLGVTRHPAVVATVTVRFTGVATTNIPEDTVVQTSGDDPVMFTTDDAGIIPGGGYIDIDCTCTVYGTVGNVGAGTITVVKVPIVGVTSITNVAAAENGEDIEEDGSYRIRAKSRLMETAGGTLAAIRAAILDVTGVLGCVVSENTTLHTVTAYVDGKTPPDTDVTDAIDDVRPAGITVTWYGITGVPIYIILTVTVNSGVPADAANLIKESIVSYLSSLSAGDDVLYMKIIDSIYDAEETDGVSGGWMVDITNLKIGIVSPPTGTSNISIADTEKASGSVSNVALTLTPV